MLNISSSSLLSQHSRALYQCTLHTTIIQLSSNLLFVSKHTLLLAHILFHGRCVFYLQNFPQYKIFNSIKLSHNMNLPKLPLLLKKSQITHSYMTSPILSVLQVSRCKLQLQTTTAQFSGSHTYIQQPLLCFVSSKNCKPIIPTACFPIKKPSYNGTTVTSKMSHITNCYLRVLQQCHARTSFPTYGQYFPTRKQQYAKEQATVVYQNTSQ